MADLDELTLADQADPDVLRRLADIEWRSEMADRTGYHAAFDDLISKVEPQEVQLWERCRDAAETIALRLYPDTFAETVVAHVIWQVALVNHSRLRTKVGAGTRMYLGRGWRKWLADSGLSS